MKCSASQQASFILHAILNKDTNTGEFIGQFLANQICH